MRRKSRMTALAVPVVALGLIVSGCGDDDDEPADTGGDTAEETDAGGAVPFAPTTITADDQSGDGTTVVVASLDLPTAGFIAVHADDNGAPGAVIGNTEILPAGESTDVEVPITEVISGTVTVWPMAHVDTNGNETYDFAPPDVTDDGPALVEEGGDVAVLPIEYSAE